MAQKHAVTGAFGFSGSYIASRLLEAGHEVLTLTRLAHETEPAKGQGKGIPV